MARETRAVRDGRQGHRANPNQRKSWQKSEGRGRRPEDAREALISSTQELQGLRGCAEEAGEGQTRSRQQALPRPTAWALRQ